MDDYTGRPNMYSDVLTTMHNGPWFNYQNKPEQTYDQLRVDDEYTKPTKAELDTALAKMQADFDALDYERKRQREYNQLNQFEMQFDDQRDGTSTWVDAINTIKDKYPKE